MLEGIKKQVYEKYAFFFLLFALLAVVTVDNEKLVVNIYRVLICLPLLLLVRMKDVVLFLKYPFVRRYCLLTVFCILSLIWSEPDHIKNMAVKIVALTVFLFLIYNVSTYQYSFFVKLDSVYIFIAMLLLALYVFSYMGALMPIDNVYGVFGNKNQLAWFVTAACLVAGYKLIYENFEIYLLGIFLILISFIWVFGSRAAIIALCFGLLFATLVHPKIIVKVLGVGALLLIPAVGYFAGIDQDNQLLLRADSHRFYIFSNAFRQITANIPVLFFGHGIASSPVNVLVNGMVMGHWHSIYISMLFYCGLIGLVLMGYCFFYRFWLLFRKKTELCVWDVVVFGLAIALMFDGNRIYTYPSGVFMSFVLPAFFANIQGDRA